MASRYNELLDQILVHATWDPETSVQELMRDRRLLALETETFPESEVRHREKIGHRIRGLIKQIDRAARSYGPSSEQVMALVEEAEGIRWSGDDAVRVRAGKLFQSRLRHAMEWHERRQAIRRAHAEARVSLRRGDSSHRLDQLGPHPAWDLVIDETGTAFGPDGARKEQGRWVGVLVPRDHLLPPVSDFHATSATSARRAEVLQALLDHEAGVFGLTVEGVHEVEADHWQVGVMALVEWTLRLLPGEGLRSLAVYVEQRGGSKGGQRWDAAATELKRQLEVRGLEGAEEIRLSLEVVPKNGHPNLAYADVVANQWHPSGRDKGALLAQSGLRGECLLEGDIRPLARCWDAAQGEGLLDREDWAWLLRQEHAEGPESLAAKVSVDLRRRAGEEPALWRHYLAHTTAHLESKAIDVELLALQEDWLEDVVPSYARNRRVELEWHLAQLKEQNHLGGTAYALSRQLAAEAEAIREEDPALACEVTLARAVVGMNAFLFDAAEGIVRPWAESEPVVPGLRRWARSWSTLGQIHAFRGEHRQARAALTRALSAFSRLADPRQARLEQSQTAAYLAVATMDDPSVSDDEARAALLAYGRRVVEGSEDLCELSRAGATSDKSAHKFLHHVLVRYLALRGNRVDCAAYVKEQRRELRELGAGHPWPLIGLWRGEILLSLGRRADGLAVIRAGAERALDGDQGPTVRLIGASLFGVLRRQGVPDLPADDALRAALREQLPAAAARVDLLAHPERFACDADLVAAVLPFNFR